MVERGGILHQAVRGIGDVQCIQAVPHQNETRHHQPGQAGKYLKCGADE